MESDRRTAAPTTLHLTCWWRHRSTWSLRQKTTERPTSRNTTRFQRSKALQECMLKTNSAKRGCAERWEKRRKI